MRVFEFVINEKLALESYVSALRALKSKEIYLNNLSLTVLPPRGI